MKDQRWKHIVQRSNRMRGCDGVRNGGILEAIYRKYLCMGWNFP